MKVRHALVLAGLAGAVATPAQAAHMAMDRPVTMNGITAVCTGIGEDARNDPRWKAYPVRIEFSNDGAQYLAGAHVVLKAAGGDTLADLECSGSWVLFQLPTGNYTVSGTLLAHPDLPARNARFSPPVSGQKRVVLEFKGVNPNE